MVQSSILNNFKYDLTKFKGTVFISHMYTGDNNSKYPVYLLCGLKYLIVVFIQQ